MLKRLPAGIPERTAGTPPLLYTEESGVRYRLQLADEKGTWYHPLPGGHFPSPTNPAWLFVDYRLYRAPDINGNMVKPFEKKEEVVIPKSRLNVFPEIHPKVAARADIEARGFEVVQQDTLEACG